MVLQFTAAMIDYRIDGQDGAKGTVRKRYLKTVAAPYSLALGYGTLAEVERLYYGA